LDRNAQREDEGAAISARPHARFVWIDAHSGGMSERVQTMPCTLGAG
jgi:hypothetical protein